MTYLKRLLQKPLEHALQRGKSVILLGARQTGKTTLLKQYLDQAVFYYNFIQPKVRRQFEQSPDSLADEVEAHWKTTNPQMPPLVIIDEVQKVPDIIDVAQYLIDNQRAQFILTGSSARKLKKRTDGDINLLPGRVIKLQLDALTLFEMGSQTASLETLLRYGSLPSIFESDDADKESDLQAYTDIYLEEEIRQEALARNLAAFSRFLELAAMECGHEINVTRLSQDIGVNVHLINEYFQILEDTLIAEKIMPIGASSSSSRRRLTKASKYLFFDIGVRRICAKEGIHLSEKAWGAQFEQFIGVELSRYIRLYAPQSVLRYWRDHSGPEIDYVIEKNHEFLPIEVKWTENPTTYDCRHLQKFMQEYPCLELAYVVCRVPRKRLLSERIMALPWQDLPEVVEQLSQK
jgi:predicted AAA+ superfamily ATPase